MSNLPYSILTRVYSNLCRMFRMKLLPRGGRPILYFETSSEVVLLLTFARFFFEKLSHLLVYFILTLFFRLFSEVIP